MTTRNETLDEVLAILRLMQERLESLAKHWDEYHAGGARALQDAIDEIEELRGDQP